MLNASRWRIARARDVLGASPLPPESLLDDAERARHARLRHSADRDDFLAARVVARQVVLEHDAAPVDAAGLLRVQLTQRCPVCDGSHGRPEVVGRRDLHLSWAHSAGVVAAAAASMPVGVDVERIARTPPPGIPGRGVQPWVTWTRIEAVVKLGLADLDTALGWARLMSRPSSGEPAILTLPSGACVELVDGVDDSLGVAYAIARRSVSGPPRAEPPRPRSAR